MQRILLITILIFGLMGIAWGTTYYVDATSGRDSSAGTAEIAAWKTITKVNGSSFNAGDFILFKKGETWREELVVPSSGSSGNPITFGAYGTGVNPIINGADLVSTWSSLPGNIWQASLAAEPSVVRFDGALGNEKTGTGAMASVGDWYWASNYLYVYATSDPGALYTNPGIEASIRSSCVYASNKSNITFQDLTLTYCESYGFVLEALSSNTISDIIVQRVASNEHTMDGFIVWGGGTETARNIQFIDCTADKNGRAGFHVYGIVGDSSGGVIYHNCKTTYAGQLEASHGFSAYNASYVHRYNCEASYTNIDPKTGLVNSYGSAEGIGFVFDDGTSHSLNHACYSHHNASSGFVATHSGSYNTTQYSISTLNGMNGIQINGGTGSNNISIYNNTIVGNGTAHDTGWGSGIGIADTVTGSTILIKNNIIKDNYEYGIRSSNSSVVADYNLTSGNGLGAASGVTPTHAVTADPLFVSSSDYHLQPISPGIDAGVDVGLTTDYAENPITGVPDIGAFEHVSTLTESKSSGGGGVCFISTAAMRH